MFYILFLFHCVFSKMVKFWNLGMYIYMLKPFQFIFNLLLLDSRAQWVHGEDGNVVHEMASEACELNDEKSWESSGLGEDVVFSYDCGEQVRKDEVETLLNLLESIKLHSAEELASFEGSLGQYFVQR